MFLKKINKAVRNKNKSSLNKTRAILKKKEDFNQEFKFKWEDQALLNYQNWNYSHNYNLRRRYLSDQIHTNR